MKIEVYQNKEEDCITVISEGDEKDLDCTKLLRTIEGRSWDDCLRKHRAAMGWITKADWVSVDEELPPLGKKVMCKDENDTWECIGSYEEERFCMLQSVARGAGSAGPGFVNEEGLPIEITHWRYYGESLS